MEAIFFPRKDYDVEICPHRLGKRMTYTDQTDGFIFQTSFPGYMGLASARNIRVGVFASYYDQYTAENLALAKNYEKAGALWIDQYSLCPSLYDKITTYQSPTEQEFVNAYQNELLPLFEQNFDRKPVALSYSYGVTGFSGAVCPLYLGGRNSAYDGATDFGVGYGSPNNQPYSFSRYSSKVGSFRWYDYARSNENDYSGSLARLSSEIDAAMQSGGWYNNFTHWHQYWQHETQEWAETYLNLLQTKNANGQIHFAGYGEAVAYLVYRQMITRAVMYSPIQKRSSQLVIRLETANGLGVDTNLLQVPISVKFTTIGTPLAGASIKSDRNLVDLGGGDYIVEIPFGRCPGAVINIIR